MGCPAPMTVMPFDGAALGSAHLVGGLCMAVPIQRLAPTDGLTPRWRHRRYVPRPVLLRARRCCCANHRRRCRHTETLLNAPCGRPPRTSASSRRTSTLARCGLRAHAPASVGPSAVRIGRALCRPGTLPAGSRATGNRGMASAEVAGPFTLCGQNASTPCSRGDALALVTKITCAPSEGRCANLPAGSCIDLVGPPRRRSRRAHGQDVARHAMRSALRTIPGWPQEQVVPNAHVRRSGCRP